MGLNECVVFQNLTDDSDVLQCFDDCDNKDLQKENQFLARLLKLTQRYFLHDHVIQSLITVLLVNQDNIFTSCLERNEPIPDELNEIVMHDMRIFYRYFHYDFSYLPESYAVLFSHFPAVAQVQTHDHLKVITQLQNELSSSTSVEEFYKVLYNYYTHNGSGAYSLFSAFRFQSETLVPIHQTDDICFDHIVGYTSQKQLFIKNTEAFLDGKEANDILLYGDSGTGKSSCVRALLPAYHNRRLKIIEVYKHQLHELPKIMEILQDKPYKFIIFMDDLSFEEYEVEYKYLKAVIEGGLTKRPQNILFYATSNRRHLIKETWADRQSEEEVLNRDAKQEKLSLAARFGLHIRYLAPCQQDYLNIVDKLVERYQISIEKKELHELALQWEIRNGGFSGRTAKQFVYMLLGNK